MSARSRQALLRLTTTAMMVAVGVVLCRLLGFPQTGAFRVELSFLPIAVVAVLYGPVWSAAAYGLCDFIGILLFPFGGSINPFIILSKTVFGLLMGLCFYKKEKITWLRNILFFILAGAIVDIGMMTPIFIFMFGYDLKAALVFRLIGYAVNTPARILIFGLSVSYIFPAVKKQLKKGSSFASYANGLQVTPRLGLERITHLMRILGDPQDSLRCIHIAGTNGKGSTSAFIESMLLAAGYKVGKYISPNLVRVNERITYCREEISDADLNRLLKKIEAVIPEAEKALNDKISQFEIWTAAMFLYFAEKKPDYVVLETGLGGEFDATNVISKNVMSVFTQIDIDHVEYLGDTIEKIATTKSRIIKKNCESGVTVISRQENGAIPVVRREAERNDLRLIVPEEAISEGKEAIYEVITYGSMKHLRLGLGGLYQIENASTAIAAVLALGLSEDSIREGLLLARNPARFEMLDTDPVTIYDGGHNPNGVRSLVASLDRYYPNVERTVVFACMADKEFAPSLQMLDNGKTAFVFTTVQNNPRAMGAEALKNAAAEEGIAGEAAPTLREALALARAKGNLTIVCGSLYLYADL